MSGQCRFADIEPVKTRLQHMTIEETDVFRKIYDKFGSGKFRAVDVRNLAKGARFSMHRVRNIGYAKAVGSCSDRWWRLSPEIVAKFAESDMIQFDPYKMEQAPFNRTKINKRFLQVVGTTIDGFWYYCQVTGNSQYNFVMCRVSHFKQRVPSCPVYKVDFGRCEEWLTKDIERNVGDLYGSGNGIGNSWI
jgi:hypothetical protein